MRDATGRIEALEGFVEDITELMESELALREAERRYRSLFDNAIEGIFRTTPNGRYLDANLALARIYGFATPAELVESLHDIRCQLYVEPTRREEFMRIVKPRGSISGFESQVFPKNGESSGSRRTPAPCSTMPAARPITRAPSRTSPSDTCTKLASSNKANYDTLTGLANRSLLHDRLQQAILPPQATVRASCAVCIDLDRFKFVNDSLGHHVGDQLLRAVAERFKTCVREYDTVARLGGDEFVLLFNGESGPDSVATVMERVLATVAEPWRHGSSEFEITCSVGVALYSDDGNDAATLLKHADSVMYRAKEHGRNNFQFFESNLRRALERGQVELYYQPRIGIAPRRIVAYEALIRWRLTNGE